MGAIIRRKRLITRKDLENALYAILGSGEEYLEKLKQKLRKILGVRYVILTISGYSALYYILKMFVEDIGINRIYVPGYSPSFYSAVISSFKDVVSFCDIDKESLLPIGDFEEDTVLICPGYFGIVREDKKISDGVVIDDFSKCIGGYSYDKVAGSFSDIGFLHLDDAAILFGDSAGVIFTNNSFFYSVLSKSIEKNALMMKPYQSAIILSQISRLDERMRLRKEKAKKIASLLEKAHIKPLQRALKDGSTFLELPFLWEHTNRLEIMKSNVIYSPIEKPIWEDISVNVNAGFPNTFYLLSKLYAIHINPYFADEDIEELSKGLVLKV